MPRISIIIPVYKVEEELARCVDSVLTQTYHNLEIILVDDGSPDRCGQIADRYAAADSRIHVIHKENGGLASARNAGMAAATGEYIAFVDSDDWVEANMYESMLEAITNHDVDMVMCGFIEEKTTKNKRWGVEENTIISGKELVAELCIDKKIHNYVWNNLYKKEILEGISFENGRIFEDLLFTYVAANRSANVLILKDAFYHYIRREDSILGQNKFHVNIEHLKADCDQARGILKINHDYYLNVVCETMLSRMVDFKKFVLKATRIAVKQNAGRIKTELAKEWHFWRGIIKSSVGIGFRKSVCLTLFFSFPLFYYYMVRIARKLRGK